MMIRKRNDGVFLATKLTPYSSSSRWHLLRVVPTTIILLISGLCLQTEAFLAYSDSPLSRNSVQSIMLRNREVKSSHHRSPLCLQLEEQTQNSEKQDSSSLKRSSQTKYLLFGSILAAILAGVLPSILPADAIDHPVDFASLKIPNPIPDADPRYFISGGICAAASHGVTTPIDVIKTRMQSEPEMFGRQGIVAAANTIVKEDGISSLLNGLAPTVLGYGVEGAVKFGLYESLKPTFVNLLSLSDPTEGYLAASVAAGAAASILLCPMEQTRIRLVTDRTFANGFVDCFSRLVKQEGIGTIFYGLPAMLSKQVPYVSWNFECIVLLVQYCSIDTLTVCIGASSCIILI